MNPTREFARRHWEYLRDGADWPRVDALVAAQLAKECAPTHPLHGRRTEVLAQSIHRPDDWAVRLEDGSVAVVPLSFPSAPDPTGRWPSTVFHPDLRALLADIELWDEEEGPTGRHETPA